jgi:indole-3-acetate monooxygenase
MTAASADLVGDRDIIARAEAVRGAVAAASDDIERGRRLPPALLDRLHEAELFRLLLPRSSNGIETDPVTFFHVIETIALADASTAWCLSQAGGCASSCGGVRSGLPRHGCLGFCVRWPPCHLARRALPDL